MKGLNKAFVERIVRDATAGRLTTRQAAAKLGCTRQYLNKLKKRYGESGASAFDHGNLGRAPGWKTSPEDEARIIELYRDKYAGFNFTHYCEKLREVEGVKASYPVVSRILKEAGFLSPKKHRTRKRKNDHPSRPRKARFGEMIQIDASLHRWFGEGFPKATLHGAVDDATGRVIGLHFDREETLRGYCEITHQIMEKYGIPACFYGDNRTVFEYRKLSEKDRTIDRDTHIQFKRICQQLGIELITTSVSQAKGRIERLWGSMQSRLVSELALRDIKTIEEANAFLPEFMRDYNRRFALEPDMEASLFAPSPQEREIDFYLSVEYRRKTDNGSCFRFLGKRMAMFDSEGSIVKIPPKSDVAIYVTRSGKTVGVWEKEVYAVEEAPMNEEQKLTKKPGKPKWIPPKNHPWRLFTFGNKRGGN